MYIPPRRRRDFRPAKNPLVDIIPKGVDAGAHDGGVGREEVEGLEREGGAFGAGEEEVVPGGGVGGGGGDGDPFFEGGVVTCGVREEGRRAREGSGLGEGNGVGKGVGEGRNGCVPGGVAG